MNIPRNALDTAAARSWVRSRYTDPAKVPPTWMADFLAQPEHVQEFHRDYVTPFVEAAWDHLTTAITEHQEHVEKVRPIVRRAALLDALGTALAEQDLLVYTSGEEDWVTSQVTRNDFTDAGHDPDVVEALLTAVLDAQAQQDTLDGITDATLAGIPTDGPWTPQDSAHAATLRTTEHPTQPYPDNLNTEHNVSAYARNLERAMGIWDGLSHRDRVNVLAQMNRHAAAYLQPSIT